MRVLGKILAIGAVLTAAACDRPEGPPPERLDLSFMDTMTWSPRTPVASPEELGLVEEAPAAPAPRATAARTAPRQAAAAPRRTTSGATQRAASAPAPATRTVVKRNTARDAAIGAGAGAVIGAVAGGSNNRVKGAIIGGAAGAVIGGVIGHTVDKKEVVVRN